MNERPLISVIIPIYNVEKYLSRCIDSVINQKYTNLEIILVNDGSPDNSLAICQEYKNKDKRIIIVNKPNGGLSSARNEGLKLCTGEYISFLDSDDWLDIEAFAKGMKYVLQHNADIVFWAVTKEFQNRSQKIQNIKTDKSAVLFENESLNNLKRRMVGLIDKELNEPTKTDAYISAWGKIYRREIILEPKVSFLDTKIVGSEDVPFNIEVFGKAKKVVYVNECLIHYWMENENSLTKNHKNTLFPRFKNLYQWIKEYNQKQHDNELYDQAVENRFALSLINNVMSISSFRNTASVTTKIKDINIILSDEMYSSSLNNLQFNYLPKQWKLFFKLARLKQGFILYLIAVLYFKTKHNN